MNGREGTAENKSSFEGSANDGRNLTKNWEEMAKKMINDMTIKATEQKPLNPETDRLSINILKRIYNGHLIAKEIEQKVIAHLSRRIVEIKSKVRNGQVLTGVDRQLMRQIIDISKNYNVKQLEIEWFKENKPLDQTKKGKIFRVDAKLIKEFTDITRTYWDKILLLSLTGLPGYVAGLLIENSRFRRIDKGLEKYNLSVHDLFEFVLSFQNSAVAKAEQMIFENRKIVREERDRYQDNKNGAIDELYNTLTKVYTPKFMIADRLRANGLKKCVKNQSSSRLQYLKETDPVLITELPKIISLSEEKLAAYIFKYSPYKAEDIAFRIERQNGISSSKLEKSDSIVDKPDKILEKYPEFELTRLMDVITMQQMRAVDASKHPILNDVNTDFREIARRFQGNQKGFKNEIIKILSNREKSADNTLDILYKSPAKVWELTPLIELTMAVEKVDKEDNTGQLIRDRIKDVGRENTIRSIGMAAMGIGLGIAGFFTGSSAWAGLALAAGGATISGVDLKYEIDAYKLHSNAAKATLGGEISDDPGVLGVTLAIFSLVLDISSLGKAIKTINDSVKLIAASGDAANTAQEAGKLFEKLKTTEKIGNVTEDEFIKTIQQAKDGIQLPKNDDIIKAHKTLKSSDGDVDKLVAASRETAVIKAPIEVKYGEHYNITSCKKVLKSNVKYTTNEGYIYNTDEFGRIKKVEANLQLGKGTRTKAQLSIGGEYRLNNDDGGHLIGNQFKGSGDIDNLVPMDSQINRAGGKWYNLEREWASVLRETPPKPVYVNIESIYSSDSLRPDMFIVRYRIGNKKIGPVKILNQPGG